MAAMSIPISSCSASPSNAVGTPPECDRLPSSPPAMVCRMKTTSCPLIRHAAPMSMVPATIPPRRIALSATRDLLPTGEPPDLSLFAFPDPHHVRRALGANPIVGEDCLRRGHELLARED